MKFSNKLSLVIMITGMIVLTIVSYTIYKISYNSIIKSQSLYSKAIADEVSDDINHFLHEKVKIALTLANTPIIKKALEKSNLSYADLSDEKRTKTIKLLDEKWKSTKDPADNFILKFTENKVSHFLKNQQGILKGEYGEIFLTNKFGALVASTAKLSTFAHGHKYWWLGSYNNGEEAVFLDDRGYDDSVGGYVLGLVVPIRRGTEIIGILKCNLNILGSISELVSGAEDKLMGKFKLTRSGGMVVFEEGFQPLSTQIHDSISIRLESKDSEPFIVDDSGKKYLVGFSEIKLTKGEKGYGFGGTFESIDHKKGNTGESWYVICYRQMNVVLAPITESIKSIVLMGFVIVVILVSVSYLFGRKIAKPLAILNKATENIGKGNFGYRIDAGANDEFGNLARSFNSMADELQQTTTSIGLLENEVKNRKQIERALKDSEKKFRKLIEQSPIVYEMYDKNGIQRMVNTAYGKLWGIDPKSTVGSFNLWETDQVESLRPYLDQAYSGTSVVLPDIHWDSRKEVGEGRDRWISTIIYPIVDGNGEVEGIVILHEDITVRKQAEEELRVNEEKLAKSKKMEAMGLMAGGVAHDLNNILSGIVSYPELLLMDLPEDSPLRKPIKTIQESGLRAADVVEDLLTMARGVVSGKEVLNLNTLIAEYLGSAEHQEIERIHPLSTFKTELDSELLNVTGSVSHVKKILMNLVTNSSEAIEGEGTVTVSTRNRYVDEPLKGYEDVRAEEYVMLTVSDNGSGISSKDLDRIFEPFYTKKVMGRSGTGLGLAVVWNSMQDHNGYINVNTSEKGTAFELYFPVTRDEVTAEKEKVSLGDYIGHGEKILVVDDEERQREIASGILTRLGYNAETVSSGEEAIEYVKENPVDLIVLDMVMPKGINGRKTYEEIIKIHPGQKAVIASGYAKTKEVDLAQELGAGKYIRKPYTMTKVGIAVKEELEK